MPRKAADDYVLFPGTVVIDTREQAPFAFGGLLSDARLGRRPVVVPTEVRGLPTGDYSLAGHEDRLCIERKSLPDLFQSLSRERDRFERELERMSSFSSAHVVVEADWWEVMERPPPSTVVPPKVVHRSVIAFTLRYPAIHWWMCPGRAFAEVTTFRIIEKYQREVSANSSRSTSVR
jgi:ERCC4-type nuclease